MTSFEVSRSRRKAAAERVCERTLKVRERARDGSQRREWRRITSNVFSDGSRLRGHRI
jgi:hypothetical protein